MPYSKLYILTELSANDVKFISFDRQKLDLSKYIYLCYRKFYIFRDTARFYENKKWPSYIHLFTNEKRRYVMTSGLRQYIAGYTRVSQK